MVVMKNWKVSKQANKQKRPWLVHIHLDGSDHICYLGVGTGKWICLDCLAQAPEEVEDIALLTRCDRVIRSFSFPAKDSS
jgi:hypothetical protein